MVQNIFKRNWGFLNDNVTVTGSFTVQPNNSESVITFIQAMEQTKKLVLHIVMDFLYDKSLV